MLVDVSTPPFWLSAEAARQGWKQVTIGHALRTQYCETSATQRDTNERVTVRPATVQCRRRQQAGFSQPRAGALSLDGMPYNRIACREPSSAACHAIPRTSIIE
jgi:hypothetical protein